MNGKALELNVLGAGYLEDSALLEHLRRAGLACSLPVLMLTAYELAESSACREQCLHLPWLATVAVALLWFWISSKPSVSVP